MYLKEFIVMACYKKKFYIVLVNLNLVILPMSKQNSICFVSFINHIVWCSVNNTCEIIF